MDSLGIVAGTWPPIQKDSPDAAFVHCRQVSQSAQCPETDMFSWLLLARRERSTPARSWPSENFPHRLALIFTTLFFERANASMPQHPKQEARNSNFPTSLAALYHQPPGATRGGKPCCRPPPLPPIAPTGLPTVHSLPPSLASPDIGSEPKCKATHSVGEHGPGAGSGLLPRLPPPTCSHTDHWCGPGTFCYAASLLRFPGPCSPTVFCSAICDCLSISGCFSLVKMYFTSSEINARGAAHIAGGPSVVVDFPVLCGLIRSASILCLCANKALIECAALEAVAQAR